MISVCIPTFEQYGHGVANLTKLFESLKIQKGDFEVVISDNSKNDDIKNLCKSQSGLEIKYIKNPIIGISHNSNNAIANASCDFIKIMYMDDLLLQDNALLLFESFLHQSAWVVSCTYWIDTNGKVIKPHHPQWNINMLKGTNTMGMPSIMAIRKNEFEFDPNLKTLLDCEYMWLLYQKFGFAKVIPLFLVGQRIWAKSTSHMQGNFKSSEYQYLRKKHNLK